MTEKTPSAPETVSETDAAPSPTPTSAPVENKHATAASKGVWMGTAVGVGSAALVAALLYARRARK